MDEKTTLPPPPELTSAVFDALQAKADLPLRSMIVLGGLAGVYIGMGGLFSIIALAGGDALPFGVAQVLAGLTFSLGLALVLVAGAELFTGNTLMAGPVLARRLPLRAAARALGVVYLANFAGALLLAGLATLAGLQDGGDGAVGRAAVDLALTKADKSAGALVASGVLANMLVCLGVWMAYGGHTVIDKIAALLLPITAFVAAGFEHSIANMYLLPFAYLVQPAWDISAWDVVANLVPVTLGNILGGASIAVGYGLVYGASASRDT